MDRLSDLLHYYPFSDPDNELSVSLSTPSFHPTITLHLNLTAQIHIPDHCYPTIALTLPDLLFPDPDELRDRLHLSPQIREWYLSDYAVDIERPERNGYDHTLNSLVMELDGSEEVYQVEIPLHARYLVPGDSGMRKIALFSGGELGSVHGGWNCDLTASRLVPDALPFITVPDLVLQLPTGRPSHQPIVEIVTTCSIWLSSAWLVNKMLRLSRRYDASHEHDKKTR